MRTSFPLAALLSVLPLLACAPASTGTGDPGVQRRQAATQGALVITEIFANPLGSSEDNKEWFEVFNTTDAPIDLDGWTFQDGKGEATLDGKAIVPPKGHAVIGQSKDAALNGGVPVIAAYGSKIGLSSDGDEVRLLDPEGNEIDAVVFTAALPWPPKTDGASLQLDPSKISASANDDGASWCLSAAAFGSDGALGSPGQANAPCGSGAGGSGQAGASAQGGSSGTSGQSGSSGTSGQAGSGGAGGSGGCQVRLHKIDLNQPDPEGAPKDAAEAVELQATGAFEGGKSTLASCGVRSLRPFDADAAEDGTCGPGAGYYNELEIGDLVIPASGFLVVGNRPGAARPWPIASSALKNGPDLLALAGEGGSLIEAVSYADNDAPGVHASCQDPGPAVQIPADANTEGTPSQNQVLVRCPGGSWELQPESAVAWGAANTCGAGAGGAPASGGSGGTGASSGASGASLAGVGGAGGDAGAGDGGASGASLAGAGGAPISGGSGGAGPGGSSPAGAPQEFDTTPGQDGDCSCRAPGGTGPSRGGWLGLALLALASRRRR